MLVLGNGDGTFTRKDHYDIAGFFNQGIAVGDLDEDGRDDLVTGAVAGYSVFGGNADGTLSGRQSGWMWSLPGAVQLADLDGDGHLDLAAGDTIRRSAMVALGRGDSSFAAPRWFPTGGLVIEYIDVGDVTSDGRPDLVTINVATMTMKVLAGNGKGAFTLINSQFAGDTPEGGKLADVNLDGDLDVITSSVISSRLWVFYGDGTGHVELDVTHQVSLAPQSAVVADFDQDGLLNRTC